jgi:putative membrane protein
MYWNYGYSMMGMHAFWWLFWLVAIAAVLVGMRGRAAAGRGSVPEGPREILQRRLASGEIEPDEYEQRLAVLNKHG